MSQELAGEGERERETETERADVHASVRAQPKHHTSIKACCTCTARAS